MRGPSGGGRNRNWRRQGTNFGQISMPLKMIPRAANQTQRGNPSRALSRGN